MRDYGANPPEMEETGCRRRRRNSSSSASIKSYTSSMVSRIRKTTGLPPTLSNLPVEIIENIVQFLPQHALYHLMLTKSIFVEVGVSYLYMAPEFASTYRYAQFAFQVSHKPYYAKMVRNLDLSYIGTLGLDAKGVPVPMAGWREFKYRPIETYFIRGMPIIGRLRGPAGHPPPSPTMKSFARTRDLPIGGLCHVLAVCKSIR